MIFLEVAMILIGLSAVIYGTRLSEPEKESVKEPAPVREISGAEEESVQELLDSFSEKAQDIFAETDEKLGQLSNEKIMGISEFSDQVMEKLDKNHEEVVFLYDMMNEKQEEVKELVRQIDSMKAELHNEAAQEYQQMKEQEKQIDEMKKSLEMDLLQLEKKQGTLHQEMDQWKQSEWDLSRLLEEESTGLGDSGEAFERELDEFQKLLSEDFAGMEEKDVTEEAEENTIVSPASLDTSVYDAEIARIEEAETKANEESLELLQQDETLEEEMSNHNEEIISLYKKGRSVLDISKMLSMGQGEVKFVIDLYKAR